MRSERRAGALLSYVYIAVNSLIILVYLPIVKRSLGSSEFGLYDLAASVINYMSIMDLGFGNGIVVYTAKYRAAAAQTIPRANQWPKIFSIRSNRYT